MTLILPIGCSPTIARAPIFQTVVADPAWQPRDPLPGPKRGAASHYRTLPTRDICALAHRFPPIALDALLFCWRLSSMPGDAIEVCRAWGFEPVSEIVWVKVPKGDLPAIVRRVLGGLRARLATTLTLSATPPEEIVAAAIAEARRVTIKLGHYVRLAHEVCIIAARPGAASRILRHDIPSVFFAPVGRHSEKPAAFFDIVERLAPGPRLELFAREPRPGWTVIGDELGAPLDLPLAPSVTRP